VVIVEIGGTVGDIEGLPFLEAVRQFKKDVGKDNVIYVHLTLVPFISAAGELKTKATQHSVKGAARPSVSKPDVLLCRTDKEHPLTPGIKSKKLHTLSSSPAHGRQAAPRRWCPRRGPPPPALLLDVTEEGDSWT